VAAAAAVTAVAGAIPASATAVTTTAARPTAGGAVAQARVLAGLESFSRPGSTAGRPARRRPAQFQLDGSLVPGAPPALNVMWLISNGYLTEVPAS
jgi:hypothetical protein